MGYGDIGPVNTGEKFICILLMLIGVISFTFTTGALSSIISSYDSSQAKLKEKTDILNCIKKDYGISEDLYDNLMKTIKYDYSKNQKDFSDFINELPYLLRNDLTWKIHENLPLNIAFFRGKDRRFVCWIGPLLKIVKCYELDYIYKQEDHINEIYFL